MADKDWRRGKVEIGRKINSVYDVGSFLPIAANEQ